MVYPLVALVWQKAPRRLIPGESQQTELMLFLRRASKLHNCFIKPERLELFVLLVQRRNFYLDKNGYPLHKLQPSKFHILQYLHKKFPEPKS